MQNDRNARDDARLRASVALPPLDELSDDTLLTRAQLAALTGVAAKTYANREAAGRPIVKVIRVAGLPRYRAGDAKRLVRGELNPTPPAA